MSSNYEYEYVPAGVIWRAVGGDPEARGIIYERYYGYSRSLVRALARKDSRKGKLSPDEEDILQDAWEKTFRDITKFRGY